MHSREVAALVKDIGEEGPWADMPVRRYTVSWEGPWVDMPVRRYTVSWVHDMQGTTT